MKKATQAAPLGGALQSSRVAAQLSEAIRDGSCLNENGLLPPELDLADRLKVSRTVVRDALSELEREGLVERVRGIGTVANQTVAQLDSRLDQKVEFFKMIQAAGHTPHADNVYVTKQEADEDLARSLRLPADGEPHTLLYVCKRVLADDEPVLYSTDILPLSLFSGKRLEKIDFSRPVFEIVAEQCGIQVTSTVAHLHAVMGMAAVRQQLNLQREEALLQLEEVCYDRLCRPVLCCRTCYTDFFDFAIVRKLL